MTAVNLNRAIRGPVTAVPVVAGRGVRLVADTVNNRFVAEVDETVLFDGEGTPSQSVTLSESIYNFEKVKIYIGESSGYGIEEKTVLVLSGSDAVNLMYGTGRANANICMCLFRYTSTTINVSNVINLTAAYTSSTSITVNHPSNLAVNIFKVVGVNRIASN